MDSWTDDTALWAYRSADYERADSAERYLKARLKGWEQASANRIASGRVTPPQGNAHPCLVRRPRVPIYVPQVGDRVIYGIGEEADGSYVVADVWTESDELYANLVSEGDPRYFTRHGGADWEHYTYQVLDVNVPIPPKQ